MMHKTRPAPAGGTDRPTPAHAAHGGPRPASVSNLPSWAHLLLVLANTASIVALAQRGAGVWLMLLVPLVVLQAVLMIGVQETKHQCVHRQFLVDSRANDLVGVLTAALFGVNFVGYRGFHLEHHRRTCQSDDPEGLLYGLSWRTRWIALFGAAETLWVAAHINWFSWRYTPRAARWRWHLNNGVVLLAAALLVTGLLRAPLATLCAWALPYCLFAWLDFLLTQAEHYGVPIDSSPRRRPPADISWDLLLPRWLSWLILHRALHRIHHAAPATRWFEAPARARALALARPGQVLTLGVFARTWLARGPRLWQ